MQNSRKLLNRYWLFLILALTAVAVSGCGGGGSGFGGTKLSSLAGRVDYYDLMGQAALPKGITVGIRGMSTYDTLINSSTGLYEMKSIPAGTYQVIVKEVASLPSGTSFLMEPPGGVSIEITPGIPMTNVNLQVTAMPGLPEL
jgi:hypothetical protein